MTLTALLIALRERRVRLSADEAGLVIDAPRRALNTELRAAIQQHAAALTALPKPFINTRGELIVPLNAPPQYHWQPLAATLRELGAPPEVLARYVPAHRAVRGETCNGRR